MSDLLLLMALYVGVGLLMVVICIPLIQRRIKPNPFYGFRTPTTLKNEQIWYEINEYSGKRLLVGGLVVMLAALVFVLVPGIDVAVYTSIVTVIMLLALGIGLMQSFRYLGQLVQEQKKRGE